MAEARHVRQKPGEPEHAQELRAQLFEATGHNNWFNPISFPIALEIIRSGLRSSSTMAPRLIDIGCGNGEFTRQFLQECPEGYALCVDALPSHIETSRRRLAGLEPRVDFLVESFEGLSDHTALQPFDCAVAFNVFHFIDEEDLDSCVRTVGRLLADGGLFLAIQMIQVPEALRGIASEVGVRIHEMLRAASPEEAAS